MKETYLVSFFQLLAEIADVDVHHIRSCVGPEFPDGVEQLRSAENSLPIAYEVLEQPEFLGSEFDGAIPAADRVSTDIDFQIATCDHHSAMRLLASKKGADPCHELLVGEGLDEVVVGTAVEPVHAVGDPIRAVSMRMGRSLDVRTTRHTSMPSIPGSIRSSTIRSGG